MKSLLNKSLVTLTLVLLTGLGAAQADEPPGFVQESFPAQGVDSAWKTYQAVFFHDDAKLDAKTKELIALGVSAQVPCSYCVYFHTRAAQAQGASDAEIKEALAVAGLVRKWSTILNGVQYDEKQWRREVDATFSGD